MTCTEIVTFVKDIVLAGAAITGATVAVKGLGTWQRQLKGQSEYELSRRILVSLFKYRDAIDGVRHPIMSSYEMPSPPEDEEKTMNHGEKNFYSLSKAYQARWDNVQLERTSLYADLLEAEVIWGKEIKELFKVIFKLEHELQVRIRHYLQLLNPNTKNASKEAIERRYLQRRDILYDDLSEDGDEFKIDLLSAIQGVEIYLKPKLNQVNV